VARRRAHDNRGPGDPPTVESETLVVSHLFDPGDDGAPYPATIRVRGRRAGVSGKPRPSDSFVREESIDSVVPGSGPSSVSTWVHGLTPGEWSVSAELVRPRADARGRRMVGSARPEVQPLRGATWSWRQWRAMPGPSIALVKTRWTLVARLARIPAVMPGAIPVLVGVGAVIALAVQAVILGGMGVSAGSALLATAVAALSGLVAAKLWYVRLNPSEPILSTGWAVDGFMVVAPLAAIAALLALRAPVGHYLDATMPGLFLVVALGRVGCFLTGCCAGRPTASRWAVWCSDQKIGARRVPTQLLESATGLVLGLTALGLVTGTNLHGTGFIFGAVLAVYLGVRHFLLRLRARPRRYLWLRSGLFSPLSQA